MNKSGPIIEIVDVHHRFGDGTRSLNGISLSFQAGEFAVIAGANGSGKTTLLRHLNGLVAPESGTVSIDGIRVADDTLHARRRVGMVFQDADSQIIGDTVYDDVAFGPENLRLNREQIDVRVAAALAAVELSGLEDKNPHHLSGGEKRRLAIAGVLAMAPAVLAMDEPFSNLDFRSTKTVLNHILALHGAGHTVIITTHDLEKVIAHAGRLIVMEQGCVVADGGPAAVLDGIERYGVRPPCSVQLGRGIRSWLS